jgi:alpha-mannosidase
LISPSSQSIKIKFAMHLPTGLTADRQARNNESTTLQIVTTATLLPGVPRLEIHTEVENPACDHRLRVHFPSPFFVDHAEYDGLFEVVRRPLGIPSYDRTWIENPRPEVPQRAFTSINDGKQGLLIANRGLYESEVFINSSGRAEIAITLLRCVGWLSRDDFATRRGHAGPGLPTPEAQMTGSWNFDYAAIPFSPDHNEKLAAYHQAYAYNAPLRAIATSIHEGTLPPENSLIEVEPLEFVVSAIKESEYGAGLTVRGYNLISEPIWAVIKPCKGFQRVFQVNLAEEIQQELTFTPEGWVRFAVQGNRIITIKFI